MEIGVLSEYSHNQCVRNAGLGDVHSTLKNMCQFSNIAEIRLRPAIYAPVGIKCAHDSDKVD